MHADRLLDHVRRYIFRTLRVRILRVPRNLDKAIFSNVQNYPQTICSLETDNDELYGKWPIHV